MAMGNNIRMLRLARGWSSSALAGVVGMSAQALHNLESRDSNRSRYTVELSVALGVHVEDLLTGHIASVEDAAEIIERRKTEDFEADEDSPAPMDLQDREFLSLLNLIPPMSLLRRRHLDEVVKTVSVNRLWLQRMFPSVKDFAGLDILTARGDSMLPTFGDEDQLLVDTNVSEIGSDGVYVLRRSDEIFTKRVQRKAKDGSIELRSDNAVLYPSETLNEADMADIEVQGKILWVWRGLRV